MKNVIYEKGNISEDARKVKNYLSVYHFFNMYAYLGIPVFFIFLVIDSFFNFDGLYALVRDLLQIFTILIIVLKGDIKAYEPNNAKKRIVNLFKENGIEEKEIKNIKVIPKKLSFNLDVSPKLMQFLYKDGKYILVKGKSNQTIILRQYEENRESCVQLMDMTIDENILINDLPNEFHKIKEKDKTLKLINN